MTLQTTQAMPPVRWTLCLAFRYLTVLMTSPSNSAPNAAGFCAACGAALSAGARFCHRCGTPVGQGLPITRVPTPASGAASVLPWGVAFLALLALVAAFAGKNFGSAKGASVDGSSNALPTASIDGPSGAASGGPSGAGPAPNIANLSPSERASKLYIRIMEYAENGKVDSVAFFAPMALASHEMLTQPSVDERYHYGRIAEVTNNASIVKAQADTILQERPTSLLGLILSATAARMAGDAATAKGYDTRLLKVLESELATKQQDYELHRAEIDRAVADARRANP